MMRKITENFFTFLVHALNYFGTCDCVLCILKGNNYKFIKLVASSIHFEKMMTF